MKLFLLYIRGDVTYHPATSARPVINFYAGSFKTGQLLGNDSHVWIHYKMGDKVYYKTGQLFITNQGKGYYKTEQLSNRLSFEVYYKMGQRLLQNGAAFRIR